jgi:EmrB/QacA subfamily drug resistance transporter
MENQKNNKILILLFIGVLMGALDISIVGPALPSIEKTIQVEQRLLGWIFSIYVLFNLVGISLFAKLSDVFGRRNIYIISVIIFAIGSLIASISENFTILLIGRAVQGFGASGIFPVASAVVGDVFPPEKRGRVLGLIGAVFGLAFILGPLLAGTLLSFFRWNVLFLINLPVALAIIIGSMKILPNHKIENSSQLDWKGIIFLGLMLGLFAYGINQTNAHTFYKSIFSTDVYPFILASFVFLGLFILVEKKALVPVVKIDVFMRKQVRIVCLIAFGTGLLQASFVFIPDYAVGTFHVTVAKASFMLIPVVTATAIGSPLFGRLLDIIGSKLVIIIGLSLACLGFFLLNLVNDQVILFYTGGALIGLGLSVLAGSSLRYIMLNEVTSIDRASTQGIITIFISVGQMVGAALIGVITASEPGIPGYKLSFLYLTVSILLLILFAFRLKTKKQELESNSKVISVANG